MRKCRFCGKELIGKEKFFCRSCFAKVQEKSIKIGKIGVVVGLLFLMKDKITNLFKGGSKDV